MAHTQPHNTGEEVKPQGRTEAFAAKSDDAFGEAFASNIVLEATALRKPLSGCQVQVTTPAAFVPGRTYNVDVTQSDGTRDPSDVVADSSGRLELQLDPTGGAVAVTVGTS
jgi:hypothetical protein